jgi:zinc transport system substrate-binding protein
MRQTPLSLVALILAGPAWAEVPSVAADTAVVHSLASMVMGDLGTPSLMVPPGTSPHDASLSPSEAQRSAEPT